MWILNFDSSVKMAATMHKLLQKPLQQGVLPYLKLQNPLKLSPSLIHHCPNLDTLPEYHNAYDFNTGNYSSGIPISSLQQEPGMNNGFHVFPTFSFEFFLDPKLSSGLHPIGAVEAEKSEIDESQAMWADSVKKKRKKKMNKHKLRKLRKRIRGYAWVTRFFS